MSDDLLLPSEESAQVRDILLRYVHDRSVLAFGSRGGGNARRYLDLDLMICGDIELPYTVMSDRREAFSNSNLEFRVDIIEWAATASSFCNIVQCRDVRFL